jgi:hypothetical protein
MFVNFMMGCKHCNNISGAQGHISMHQYLLINHDVKWYTCHICSIIPFNKTSKIKNILRSIHKNQGLCSGQKLIVNGSIETLPAGFLCTTQLLRNLLHRKIHLFCFWSLHYWITLHVKLKCWRRQSPLVYKLLKFHVHITLWMCATFIWHWALY